MKKLGWKKKSAVLLTGIFLTACNGPLEQKSNLNTDSASAKKKMEDRLAETVKLRQITRSIENALRPIDGTLNDVLRILGAEKDRLKGELPRFVVSEVRYAMEALSNDMAIEQKDGSWVIEKQVQWPFERLSAVDQTCAETHVGISARNLSKDGKNVEADVYIRDCVSLDKITVARIERREDGNVTLEFNSSALKGFETSSTKVGENCLLQLEPGKQQFICQSFEAQVSSVKLKFADNETGRGIWYQHTSEGEEMKVVISGYKADGTNFADLTIEQALGSKPKVKLTRKSAL